MSWKECKFWFRQKCQFQDLQTSSQKCWKPMNTCWKWKVEFSSSRWRCRSLRRRRRNKKTRSSIKLSSSLLNKSVMRRSAKTWKRLSSWNRKSKMEMAMFLTKSSTRSCWVRGRNEVWILQKEPKRPRRSRLLIRSRKRSRKRGKVKRAEWARAGSTGSSL